jgi:type IV secretory pathway TrbL component
MFETILLQVAGTSTTTMPTLAESLSTLVNSVALAVGAIAPIIVSILAYTKAKSHDPKIDEAINTGISVGKMATATANKALENKENIKTLLDIGLKIAPQDTQQAIAAKQALIDKLNKEIQATTVQIKQLKPMIPGKADADTDPNLKRENDFPTTKTEV